MDSLKKQILIELVVTPYTVIPTTLGLACGILSLVIPPLSLFAFIGIGFGVAALLTNLMFNTKSVAERATKRWHRDQRSRRNKELDDLDRKLVKDRDSRTQSFLRDLRQIYFSFVDDQANGKIKTSVSSQILDHIDKIFETCVNSLRHSYELWEQSQKMSDSLRHQVEAKRNKMLEEVKVNVTQLFEAISEVRALCLKSNEGQIDELQKRLRDQLEVAQSVDRMAAIGVGDDLSQFDEYLTN